MWDQMPGGVGDDGERGCKHEARGEPNEKIIAEIGRDLLAKNLCGWTGNSRSSGTKIAEKMASQTVSRKRSTSSLGTWSNIDATGAKFQTTRTSGGSAVGA